MDVGVFMQYVTDYGWIAIYVIVLLEYLNLPGFPAGVIQMDFTRYCISSTLGIVVWNLVFVGAGYLFGDVFLLI